MNLNLYEGMDGLVLREREGSLLSRTNAVNAVSDTGSTSSFPKNTPLAMAYVPFQQWGEIYPEDEAFESGTLFPELDFPFENGGAGNE